MNELLYVMCIMCTYIFVLVCACAKLFDDDDLIPFFFHNIIVNVITIFFFGNPLKTDNFISYMTHF